MIYINCKQPNICITHFCFLSHLSLHEMKQYTYMTNEIDKIHICSLTTNFKNIQKSTPQRVQKFGANSKKELLLRKKFSYQFKKVFPRIPQLCCVFVCPVEPQRLSHSSLTITNGRRSWWFIVSNKYIVQVAKISPI